MERFVSIAPFERMCQDAVEVFDKGIQSFPQLFFGREAAVANRLARDDSEHDFDLVHPRSVFWGVVKDQPMLAVAQEALSRGHVFEDAAFPLDAESLGFEPLLGGYIADQLLGLMGVEIVQHEAESLGLGMLANQVVNQLEEIRFGSAGQNERGQFPAGHAHGTQEAQGAMALVFILHAADQSRAGGLVGGDSFQSLNAGHLID